MLKHEAKLIDPDANAIVTALTETTAAANKRCRARLLEDAPAKWKKFAKAVESAPEGYAMFRGGRGGVPATQVLAAWWTDAIGRKHVVLRGRRVEHDEAKRLLQKEELDTRSPLWHAYPEYVCRRTVGDVEQIVCACGCGAVGTPDSLSWMGETCGPCFDRKEELGPAGLSANLPGVLYGDRAPLGAVACAPDGNRVAAEEGDNCVSYWDIPNRTRTTMKFSGHPVTDVAITSDARYLLVTGVGLVQGVGLFAAFDLTTDPPTRIEPTLEFDPAGLRIVALPDPERALFQQFPHGSHESRAEVVRVPSGEPVWGVDLPPASYGRLSITPDGARFACCGSGFGVYELETMTPVVQVGAPTVHVALSAGGRRLFCALDRTLTARDAGTGRPLFSLPPEDQRRLSADDGYIRALVADPQGEFVFAGAYNGRLFALATDTLRLRATFEWHLGPITGLAVSADGSRLFSSGGDGCVKVWPIRDLLRGV